MPSPSPDWDTPVTVTARRGDVAAAAQTLGHTNNLNDETIAFKAALTHALEQAPSPSTHQEPTGPWMIWVCPCGVVENSEQGGHVHYPIGDEESIGPRVPVVVIPDTAPLSDEAVRAAVRAFEAEWRKESCVLTSEAMRLALQAAIQAATGGDDE